MRLSCLDAFCRVSHWLTNYKTHSHVVSELRSRQLISLMSQGLSARCPARLSHFTRHVVATHQVEIKWATHYVVFFPQVFGNVACMSQQAGRPALCSDIPVSWENDSKILQILFGKGKEGGKRGRKGWANGGLSMRTSRALQLLICMSYLVQL